MLCRLQLCRIAFILPVTRIERGFVALDPWNVLCVLNRVDGSGTPPPSPPRILHCFWGM